MITYVPWVDHLRELAVREAAMDYVESCTLPDGTIDRSQLESFEFDGRRLPLVDRGRGIRSPVELAATLTIMTTQKSPYSDVVGDDGLLRYDMRVGDPNSGDNRKLAAAWKYGLPIIWLLQVEPAVFTPLMPVYLVDVEPELRRFVVAIGDDQRLISRTAVTESPIERRYVERQSKQRLHQPMFRARVLRAYRGRCCICSLRHVELLDAAHILGDAQDGKPIVANGLSLCKIHHAAFDKLIMGISPDLRVHVDEQVLLEVDGPMLRHGIQELHGRELAEIPSKKADRPDADLLAQRFEQFLAR